jgi:hypothetical protein
MKSAKSMFANYKILARFAAIAFLFAVCSVARLHAQGYGSIVGTVTDSSGAMVAGATITATQTNTGRQTVVNSGQTGAFVFPTLLPSGYSLTVASAGFETYQQKDIVLQADQTVTVNAKLTVGAATQTVEVTSSVPQVDTTSGTLSQVIDQARVVDLPLNGRNAAALVTLVAGVVDASSEGNGADQGVGKTFPVAVVTSVNGTLPNQSNYLLDGGNNVDEMTNVNDPFPFPDALQEFSVQTSNYNAEFGQSAGGVVNIVTKSGGNKFHGAAFEFLRNGIFDANSYFSTTRDTLHQHQFGGTIGGPVIIPHISTGASTQFFFGYQHRLIHSASTSSSTVVPTLAEEGLAAGSTSANLGNLCNSASGNSFAASGANIGLCVNSAGVYQPGQQVINPFTNVTYLNNIIPVSDFDPASVAFEKVFPTFTGTETPGKLGGTVNYFKPSVTNYDEYIARVDHAFSDKDHMFGHYYYDFFQQAPVFNPAMLASYTSYFNTRYQNALLAETHTFTVNLLNNLVLNYQREVSLRGGPPGSQDITAFGVTNIWQPGTGPYMTATVNGYFGESSSAFAGWLRNNYTLNDDLHWTKGNHNVAFGGHIELSKFDVTNDFQSYGGFGFNVAGAYINQFANFQVGFMGGSGSFNQGNYELLNDRNHFPGLYAQDSWKATPRLTIDYGVRWEDFAPWANRIGVQTVFSPSNYAVNKATSQYSTLPAGFMLSGDPGVAKNGLNNKYAQFMPRVGFAYDVFGEGKTVVRGGTGIFYQDRMPGFFNLNQAGNVPNTISVSLTNPGMYSTTPGANPGGPFSNPYCQGGCGAKGTLYPNPFPFTLPFASSHVFPNASLLEEFDPSGNFRVPVTYDYNLTIEQQLAPNWAMRLAYVGSGSRHQFVNLELNPAVNTTPTSLSTNQRRPYNTAPTVGPCTSGTGCLANYANIVEASMSGNAHYNSLQATIEKKMSHGLSLLANYTWSKSYDDMPQATRVSNTEDLNAGVSYVYPLYPASATGIPAAAIVPDIKALDRGLSDIDHPNVMSVSYVYELPKLHGDGAGFKALETVTNGWRLTGLFQHHSGDVLTPTAGADQSLTGLGQDRAQRDFTQAAYLDKPGGGKCTVGKNCVNWLNPSALSTPTSVPGVAGTGFGNVMKGSLRGPGYTNWDAGVARTFPIYRETDLEFRVEYFDVLNHTELGNPNTTTTNAAFGTITGLKGGPRIGQFSLKYLF